MTMTLTVPSMKCEGCVESITNGIKGQDEQAKVTIDLEKKTVEVDSTLSEDSIKQAIAGAGHTVS